MPEIPGRDEQILQSIIDGTEYNKKPKSRIEALLLELKEVIEEGGGVSDYEALENLPQINSVTLIGNKSLSDLGLVNPMTIKGRVNTVADLDNIQNPQAGWVYFVGSASATELAEYVYIAAEEGSANLLNEATAQEGYINSSTGEYVTPGSLIVSDFIPIDSSASYTFSVQSPSSSFSSIDFAYYADSEFISLAHDGSMQTGLIVRNPSIPANATRMRIAYQNRYTQPMFNAGDQALPYAPYKPAVAASWQFLGYNTIVIDSSLSTTSENPVQNKVITNALSGKVNTVDGKGLSTEDYTTAEKNKLAGLSNYDDTEVRGLIATKADASILTPISESAYEALVTKDKPLYFIYD